MNMVKQFKVDWSDHHLSVSTQVDKNGVGLAWGTVRRGTLSHDEAKRLADHIYKVLGVEHTEHTQ